MSVKLSIPSGFKRVPLAWIIPAPLAGFIPLWLYWGDISKFFYQDDEWGQLSQLEADGLFIWLFSFFGESFVPVFKLFWAGLLFAGNGNYHVFVLVSFTLHAVVVFLFGYVLRQWEFDGFVIVFSQMVLAVNYTHIEILTQSIRVSNLLSYGFLLGLVIFFFKPWLEGGSYSTKLCICLCVLSSLGALSFVRGVLNGIIVGVVALALYIWGDPANKKLLRPAKYAMIPSMAVGLIVALGTLFNQSALTSDGAGGSQFLDHFFFQITLNPWYQQLRNLSLTDGQSLLLLEFSVVIICFAFYFAKDFQKSLLILLLVFFLGNGFLLALGRSHLSLDHAVAWRYQYGCLIAFAPLVAIVIERILRGVPFRFMPVTVGVLVIWWTSSWVFDHWKYHIPAWAEERGTKIRSNAAASKTDLDAHTISTVENVSDERALELIEGFNLR